MRIVLAASLLLLSSCAARQTSIGGRTINWECTVAPECPGAEVDDHASRAGNIRRCTWRDDDQAWVATWVQTIGEFGITNCWEIDSKSRLSL